VYLGAPGHDHASADDDFTPPFPSYTSGHATMGGAIFKSIELFYGTNNFNAADIAFGVDPIDSQFTLYSNEKGGGGSRNYVRFTQEGLLDVGLENSPEGENGMSRVYLGVHWLFDQTDGITLGNAIAEYAASNHFYAVPEPATGTMLLMLSFAAGATSRRHRRS
jgi:hypothetical protein